MIRTFFVVKEIATISRIDPWDPTKQNKFLILFKVKLFWICNKMESDKIIYAGLAK